VTNRVRLNSFFLCAEYYCLPSLFIILIHFSNNRYNWSLSTNTFTFRNFPGISDLLSDVSKFQHHKIWAQDVALHLSLPCAEVQSADEKSLLPDESCFYHGNARFSFTCIICYTAEIFEMFHAFRLYFIYHKLRCGWLPWGSHLGTLFSVPYHPPISVSLWMMPRRTVSFLASTTS
jgi:hypothetical protein